MPKLAKKMVKIDKSMSSRRFDSQKNFGIIANLVLTLLMRKA